MNWRRRHRQPEYDPDETDGIISSNVGLARRLGTEDRARLSELALELVATKRWEPIAPLELDLEIALTIAANASIPLLGLGTSMYRSVNSIIVRSTFVETSSDRGGATGGVVRSGTLATIGEAAPHSGPMSISWDAALADSRRPEAGHNVVIHEFAHKIDMVDGYTDGTPPLNDVALSRWGNVLADEYERPDVRQGDEVLGPYAWSNPAEFFAVASEAFFCTPLSLDAAKPELYRALVDFYCQDPSRWGS